MNIYALERRARKLTISVVSLASLVGCSGAAGSVAPDETTLSSTPSTTPAVDPSSTPTIETVLPEALGGTTESVALAPSFTPKELHSYGLDGPTPPDDESEVPEDPELFQPVAASSPNIDISRYAPSVGDQGAFNSCVTWAEGYSSMSWWTSKSEDGIGEPFNPMFLYSQVNGGNCKDGTTLETVLKLLHSKGDIPRRAYGYTHCKKPTQSDFDFASLHEATHYRSGFPLGQYHECGTPRFPLMCRDSNQTAILNTLKTGPIVIAIQVYSEFENADRSHYVVGTRKKGSKFYGNHAVTVFKADSQGVWIQNQWGTGWGRNGWAKLTWKFINSGQTFDAVQITGIN